MSDHSHLAELQTMQAPSADVMVHARQLSHCQASCSSPCEGARSLHSRPFTRSSFSQRLHPARTLRAIHVLSQSPGSSLSDLQQELNAAVSAEDYSRAATLRDQLELLRQDSATAVLEANKAFYTAFENSNLKAMEEIWGYGEHIQCMHPAANCIAGRNLVLESWGLVLQGDYNIRLEEVRTHVTQNMAFVTCVEIMNAGNASGRTAATNVFEKQDGKWKMVLHHGGPIPTPQLPM